MDEARLIIMAEKLAQEMIRLERERTALERDIAEYERRKKLPLMLVIRGLVLGVVLGATAGLATYYLVAAGIAYVTCSKVGG
jgi:hypothetical protein